MLYLIEENQEEKEETQQINDHNWNDNWFWPVNPSWNKNHDSPERKETLSQYSQ